MKGALRFHGGGFVAARRDGGREKARAGESETDRQMDRERVRERRGARNVFDRPARESERGRRARSHCDRRVQSVGRCRCQLLHHVALLPYGVVLDTVTLSHTQTYTDARVLCSRCAATIGPFVFLSISVRPPRRNRLHSVPLPAPLPSRKSRDRSDSDRARGSLLLARKHSFSQEAQPSEGTHVHAAGRRTREDDVRRRSAGAMQHEGNADSPSSSTLSHA